MTFRFNTACFTYAVVFGTPLLFAVSYIMAAWQQHVPWCFPPIHGCTTISETAMYAPESYIFRFGAYPLVIFQALLFYVFKQWLEEACGKPLKRARIAWRMALAGCVCMIGSMAVMQGPNETAEPAHTILAVGYYLLVLSSQGLFTWEDFCHRRSERRTPLALRIGTVFLQLALLASAALVWLVSDVFPYARYQWLLVATFFLWHASFLFERKSVLLEPLKQTPQPVKEEASSLASAYRL